MTDKMKKNKNYNRIPFSLEKYLTHDYYVVTEDGVPVIIIHTDSPSKTHPIVGYIDGEDDPDGWTANGKYFTEFKNSINDLYLVPKNKKEEKVNEPVKEEVSEDTKTDRQKARESFDNIKDNLNLTEFEVAVTHTLMDYADTSNAGDKFKVRLAAAKLLEVAKKQLMEDGYCVEKKECDKCKHHDNKIRICYTDEHSAKSLFDIYEKFFFNDYRNFFWF